MNYIFLNYNGSHIIIITFIEQLQFSTNKTQYKCYKFPPANEREKKVRVLFCVYVKLLTSFCTRMKFFLKIFVFFLQKKFVCLLMMMMMIFFRCLPFAVSNFLLANVNNVLEICFKDINLYGEETEG